MKNSLPNAEHRYDQRKRDLLEVFASKVASLPTPRILHHAFSWDVSQNVHGTRTQDPVLQDVSQVDTSSYLACRMSHRCREVVVQRYSRRSSADWSETEVQLSDLAGNAMSLTVVSACTLAALCVKEYARRRIKDNSFRLGTFGVCSSVCSRILVMSTLLLTSLEHLKHQHSNTKTQVLRRSNISPPLHPSEAAPRQQRRKSRVQSICLENFLIYSRCYRVLCLVSV